jgi:hypothetical protein
MFQFTGFAPIARYYIFNIVGFPIRIFTDLIVCADPRNFSQLITSFFASESLGIPHTPLFSLCLLLFYSLLLFDKNISTLIALLFLILLRYHYSNMSMNFNLVACLWYLVASNTRYLIPHT